MYQVIENITLNELVSIEGISVRLRNICFRNGLNNINSILNYYQDYGDFLRLRNCGYNSNSELIEICKKYKNNELKSQILVSDKNNIYQEDDFFDEIDTLTSIQKQVVNNLIERSINNLTTRSSNALRTYLDSDVSLKELKYLIVNQDSEIKNIPNVGEKSIQEIIQFIQAIKETIQLVSLFNNENEIRIELFNSYLIKRFSINPSVFSEICSDYDFCSGIPIFRTIKILIDYKLIFDEKEKLIFLSSFKYFLNNETQNLHLVAKKLNFTRERARQIRQRIFENFNETFSFLNDIETDVMNFYGIDFTVDYIIIDEKIAGEINDIEKTQFNNLFINKILSIVLSKRYILIGNEENIIFGRILGSEHNWISTYLVSINLYNIFDFAKFINDVSIRLKQRREEEYRLNFEAYLLQFFDNEYNLSYIESVKEIAEYMLFNEFNLTIDIDESIVFKSNVKKQVISYIYDVLEERKVPLTVYEIFELIEERNAGVTKSPESLRGSCQRDPNLIFFGRSSTYGLKKWEEELSLKGGTIRDIAEEFLFGQEAPKHIDEITEYINKYRDTNSKNIYANLKMDESKRFIFYTGTFIGLKSKKYSSEKFVETNLKHKSVKTWEESYEQLRLFTESNNRLPYSTGSEEEKRLYRFFNIQERKNKNGELDIEKSLFITELLDKYYYKVKEKHKNY